MSMNSKEGPQNDATEPSRRCLLGGAGLATAAAFLGTASNHPAQAKGDGIVPAPVYYPTPYKPEVSLLRKNIVVTGASRGIGRATALELVKAGANVWGTSRTPEAYPSITEYPVLKFRLEDPASIADLVRAIGKATRGRVDVLINNAGQFVFGGAIPPNPAAFDLWVSNSALALQVIYLGHRTLTVAMLPLMRHLGYRRIAFTASTAAYASGWDVYSQFYQPYTAGKRAVADFANMLRDWFALIKLDIGVATVNPAFTHTDGPVGLRPIFLEPVDSAGNPDPASPLASALPFFRAARESAQPPTVVAQAYRQLLELNRPHHNVVAAIPRGPLADGGGVPLILAARQKEMEESAMLWKAEEQKHGWRW